MSKIRSHLSADEISDLRVAEMEGRFRPQSTVCAIGSSKISAAAHRLKLDTGRAVSARVPPATRVDTTLLYSRQASSQMTADDDDKGSSKKHIVIVDKTSNRMPRTNSLQSMSMSSFGTSLAMSSQSQQQQNLRPFTSVGKRLSSASPPRILRPRTAPGSTYSSHESATREAKNSSKTTSITNLLAEGSARGQMLERRSSVLSNSSIGSNLAKERAAERRQDLLDEEMYQQSQIENRRQDFLDRISVWVKENPTSSVKERPLNFTDDPDESGKKKSLAFHNHVAFRQRRQTKLTADEKRLQEDQMWKDLSKCRYLRISDDKLDVSGVNTLAKDQMAVYETLRNTNKKKTRLTVEMETLVEL